MSTLKRLEASAERISDLRKALKAEMKRRNGLIRQAMDEGETYKVTSTAARRSIGTVAEVVGRGPDEDEE
ncbi:hypothetical protein [Streptomyces laurentii]|uniref:hypothetical protein n=1 Tax=Streptomyces laurentii TaxID=39478 RepID=UPI003680C012